MTGFHSHESIYPTSLIPVHLSLLFLMEFPLSSPKNTLNNSIGIGGL